MGPARALTIQEPFTLVHFMNLATKTISFKGAALILPASQQLTSRDLLQILNPYIGIARAFTSLPVLPTASTILLHRAAQGVREVGPQGARLDPDHLEVHIPAVPAAVLPTLVSGVGKEGLHSLRLDSKKALRPYQF